MLKLAEIALQGARGLRCRSQKEKIPHWYLHFWVVLVWIFPIIVSAQGGSNPHFPRDFADPKFVSSPLWAQPPSPAQLLHQCTGDHKSHFWWNHWGWEGAPGSPCCSSCSSLSISLMFYSWFYSLHHLSLVLCAGFIWVNYPAWSFICSMDRCCFISG